MQAVSKRAAAIIKGLSRSARRLGSAISSLAKKPRVRKVIVWSWDQITLKRFVLFALALPVAIYIWREAHRPIIVLDPIEVPKFYSELGLTSVVITERVRQRIGEIQSTEESAAPKNQFSLISDLTYPDIEIPEAKVSVNVLMDAFRRAVNNEPEHLSAEITSRGDEAMELGCRLVKSGEALDSFRLPQSASANPEDVVQNLAEQMVELTDPFLLAVYFERRKDYTHASQVAMRMAASQRITQHTDAEIALIQAFIADDDNQTNAAGAEYAKAIALDSNWAYPHLVFGKFLGEKRRDSKGAEAEYRQAIKLDPKYAVAHYNLGSLFEDERLPNKAKIEYERAIRLDPTLALAHNNLGDVLTDEGNATKAAIEYQKAFELRPNFAAPHNNLGDILAEQHNFDRAGAEYQRAIQLDPYFANPHDGLGDLFLAQHKPEQAEAEYQLAIKLDPSFADPHDGLGQLWVAKHELGRATVEYEKAIDLDHNYARAHYHLALLLKESNKLEQADAEFKIAHKLEPRHF